MYFFCVFFFFQAEDGIRDGHVTGVQTCALPICAAADAAGPRPRVPGAWHVRGPLAGETEQIGRASCRERVEISVGVITLEEKRDIRSTVHAHTLISLESHEVIIQYYLIIGGHL